MWFVGKPGLDHSGHLGKGLERSVSLQETVSLRKVNTTEYKYKDK